LKTCRRVALRLLLPLAALPSLVLGQGQSTLELDDGSLVVGEVLSLSNGVYSVRSSTVGTVRIDAAHIRTIRLDGAADGSARVSGPAAGGDRSEASRFIADIGAMQQRLAAEPGLMDLVMGLQNDPQLRQALADPQLMALIAAGDLNALRANPGVRALMNHPSIRAILERMVPDGQ